MAKKTKTANSKVKKVITKAPKRKAAPRQLMSQGDLLSLLRTVKSRQADMDEARGSMGAAVKLAQEKKFLDRTAFAIFRRLDRLPDVRLKNVLRNLDHYRAVGGLNTRASRQLDAFEEVANIAAKKNGGKKSVEEAPVEVEVPPQMDLSERNDIAPVH